MTRRSLCFYATSVFVNLVDASALETLTDLWTQLKEAGVDFYLIKVKRPVMEQIGPDRIFLRTQEAFEKLRSEPNRVQLALQD